MIVGSSSICSEELRNLPERGVVPRLEVLSGFPDIVVVCEKIVLVLILLFADGIVVLFGRILGYHFKPRYSSTYPSLGASAVSLVRVYVTELSEVSCPLSLRMG
jgi:hypothetical protein